MPIDTLQFGGTLRSEMHAPGGTLRSEMHALSLSTNEKFPVLHQLLALSRLFALRTAVPVF
jgi:hypothetical protein